MTSKRMTILYGRTLPKPLVADYQKVHVIDYFANDVGYFQMEKDDQSLKSDAELTAEYQASRKPILEDIVTQDHSVQNGIILLSVCEALPTDIALEKDSRVLISGEVHIKGELYAKKPI